MYTRALCLMLMLMLMLMLAVAAHGEQPPGITWFNGGVEDAFIAAQREGKPVFLYWGASWCPSCQQLKATVFARKDFQEKSKLFVPVYLDGDDGGAQKYGDLFRVQGYPTLVVLDSKRHEIMRIAGSMDLSQYASALDNVLADLQPVDALLQAAAVRKLSVDECRRLAFNAWGLEDVVPKKDGNRARQLTTAAASCPVEALAERARLSIFAAYFSTEAQAAALEQGKPPSVALAALINQVASVLTRPMLAASVADALQYLDENFFKAVRARGTQVSAPFLEAYVAVMDAAASDPRYAQADQIAALGSKLQALNLLGSGKLPKDVALSARRRVDAALASARDPAVRSGIIDSALTVFDELGQNADAYQVIKAEIANSKTPYYYEADLAELAEKLQHKDEALMLLDQSYRDSRGTATRFQWGQRYVSGLIRMAPNDTMRIQDAGVQVLTELDGPDRIYRRARVRLEKLDGELRAWNTAAGGRHKDVLQALRARMQQICVKIPATEPARGSCDAFLRPTA